MPSLAFDIAHLLAGSMLVLSFVLLYQDRITAVLNAFALQAIVLALSVAWQALAQHAPHLLVTAAVALLAKGFIVPIALHRIVRRLKIHREIEQVIGGGPTMLTGLALVALSILLVEPVKEGVNVLTREDLAFALAVILLGFDDDHTAQCGHADCRIHVAGEWARAGGDGRQGHAAGGGILGRVFDPHRLHRVRRFHFSYP